MNFKQFRTEKGLTQAQAGALIGMSAAYWSQLETGQESPQKERAFARVLTYIDHNDIDLPLTAERMKSIKDFGLNFSQASEQIGASANVWSNLLNGHLPAKLRWIRSVNALLIELAEKQADLDLTPGGEIEVLMPQVLTPEPEAPVVEEEISDQPGLIPFAYGSQKIRMKWINGEPWFCLVDICKAINYESSHNAASLIDEDELQKLGSSDSMGRAQLYWFTSEAGMYQFLGSTHTEAAKPFRKWVNKEVLPTIRKTGGYQAQNIQINDPLSQAIMIGQALQTFGKEIQAMQARELVREQKIANLEQAAQQVKYLEIAKTDRSEVLEIVQSELIESKTKEKIEQLNHYRQRKDLEKRVAEVAWLAIKAHGGDHGEIIKGINKRIRAGLKGAHGYVVGREHYQAQDFAMAYQIVAMVEKEIGDFPKQGEIDFGKDK